MLYESGRHEDFKATKGFLQLKENNILKDEFINFKLIRLYQRSWAFNFSVDFDLRVDYFDESVRSIETNSTGQNPERKHDDSRVSEVQKRGNNLGDFKLCDKVEN